MIDLFSSPFDGNAGANASSRSKRRRRHQPEPAGTTGAGSRTTTPAEEQPAPGAASPLFRMISTGRIDPNDYNANEMSPKEFTALRAEVRRLGRPPKPIVVREVGERYEVVDGEHGLRAAQAEKIAEVPCEVIEADDIEAVRQNYTRNEHGTRNPLKQARAFERLKDAGNLSNRKLAAAIGIPEATIRTSLDYVKAFELRNCCAPKTAEKDIARLSVRQVQCYLQTPDRDRDAWLDGGADLAVETPARDQTAQKPAGKATSKRKVDRKPARDTSKDESDEHKEDNGSEQKQEEGGAEAQADEDHGHSAGKESAAQASFEDALQGVRTAVRILERNEEPLAELASGLSAEEKAQMLKALEDAAGAVGRLQSLLAAGEAVAVAEG